ncbi:F-box domain-containing protein [Heracleum sosnowskyi]|uniref:F-box domain-containing protein n=1 Tax=Heracleum sosnowskyi TaxID=360622 RepID=A0AAD8HWV5_9APIA|nr:F-box domain-containing protein [Heracleum sosnowskyi]
MDKFSADLIHKIFIWVPIKSLTKLKCVSKSWCKIIDDPLFALMQYDCGKVDEKTLLLSTINHSESTTSLYAAVCSDDEEDRMIRAATVPMVKVQTRSGIFGSCNGLLYFADAYAGSIVVSNPVRSQFTILPPTPFKMYCWESYYSAIGLGFDSLTKTFKMVCTNQPGSTQITLVHTLGTSSWREVPSFPAYYCGHVDSRSVFVHGFLHWMMDSSMIKNGRGRILAFDVSKETFEVVPHPQLSFEKHMDNYFRILDFKGNLGMLDLSSGTKFDLWVMDYDKKSWSKELTIDISIVGKIHVDITQVIGLWKRDEILFLFSQRDCSRRGFVEYWSYGMRTGNLKECEDQSSNAQVFSLKGSLISIPDAMEVS